MEPPLHRVSNAELDEAFELWRQMFRSEWFKTYIPERARTLYEEFPLYRFYLKKDNDRIPYRIVGVIVVNGEYRLDAIAGMANQSTRSPNGHAVNSFREVRYYNDSIVMWITLLNGNPDFFLKPWGIRYCGEIIDGPMEELVPRMVRRRREEEDREEDEEDREEEEDDEEDEEEPPQLVMV
jgi:hypothetical protein